MIILDSYDMKYILDTHYILWTLFKPELIINKIKDILENDKDIKYDSPEKR